MIRARPNRSANKAFSEPRASILDVHSTRSVSESSKAAGAREARLAADAAVVIIIIIIIGCAAGVLRLRPRLNGRTSDETKASPSPSTFSSVSLPLLLFVPFLSSQISCTHNDRTNEDRTNGGARRR